jgi:hypothetical protein
VRLLLTANWLFIRLSRKLPRRFHLATQPFRRDVKAVRPRRCALFKDNAGKIVHIPQRFQQGTGFIDQSSEVVHAFAAIGKAEFAADRVKIRRRIVANIHPDSDAVKPSNRRHCAANQGQAGFGVLSKLGYV